MSYSHDHLVKRAASWLRNKKRCGVVIVEGAAGYTRGACKVIPDAIGWYGNGQSILVECKTSLSDFYSDRKKPSYTKPGHAPGSKRYYMTEKGLIKPELLPNGWGLLEVTGKKRLIVREVVAARQRRPKRDRRDAEITLLYAELRRVLNGWRKERHNVGVFVAENIASDRCDECGSPIEIEEPKGWPKTRTKRRR